MKNITNLMKSHLQQDITTLCTAWKVKRTDNKEYGFTDFNKDLFFNGIIYYASNGYKASAIKSNSELSVDNLEITSTLGGLSTSTLDGFASPEMTESDISAGLWDYAAIQIHKLNYEDLSPEMGSIWLRSGTFGQIVSGRTTVQTEMRGMTQPLQQSTGRIFGPGCAANFGDGNCRKNKADFTFNGVVNTVLNQKSWIDLSLNQTNSTSASSITAITLTNPIYITSNAHGLQTGEEVSLSGINGMTELNGLTTSIIYSDINTFGIAVNSTNFTAYTSGGLATKTIISEYFKDGYVEWLSGNNKGLKNGIAKYSPTFVSLYDNLVYEIQKGDTYKIIVGCDKLISTCHDRFDNVVNFYGFNLVPGQDKWVSGT